MSTPWNIFAAKSGRRSRRKCRGRDSASSGAIRCRRVQKWASDSIEVTGSVPSVVEHLRQAAVVIVPLRIGGGTRLKIYEAMAAGKAVVSTTVGAEGLDVHHGRDIILADDARAFSQAVIMLLRDRDLRRRYEGRQPRRRRATTGRRSVSASAKCSGQWRERNVKLAAAELPPHQVKRARWGTGRGSASRCRCARHSQLERSKKNSIGIVRADNRKQKKQAKGSTEKEEFVATARTGRRVKGRRLSFPTQSRRPDLRFSG